MTVSAACIAFRVSRRCYYRWLPRWQEQGRAGLIDRSRPHRSPQRLSLAHEQAIVTLRQKTGRGADFLAALLGLPASTVHRVIRRQGLSRQRAERAPVVRYEYSQPGDMVHVDTKKLGRIVGGPGDRIHRDHSRENRGVGWEVMHMAIDDATRLVYAEILGDEKDAPRRCS
jgi:transposase